MTSENNNALNRTNLPRDFKKLPYIYTIQLVMYNFKKNFV